MLRVRQVIEAVEHTFDDVAQLMEFCVISELSLVVSSQRDAGDCLDVC